MYRKIAFEGLDGSGSITVFCDGSIGIVLDNEDENLIDTNAVQHMIAILRDYGFKAE